MFFILSKIFFFFLQPIVWILTLLLFSLFSKNNKKKYLVSALSLLLFFSNKFIFNEFSSVWELPSTKIETLDKKYKVAIVLGGIVHQEETSENIDFGRNADRILQVLPLYFSGQVEKILIAGGSGSLINDNVEAEILANYLIEIGVKKEDLLLEKTSRNTYENALNSITLLNEKSINESVLLCTSSMHMRRSAACFNKLGLDPDLLVVDLVSEERKWHPAFLILPDAQTLSEWYWLLHEWVGILIYKAMGYC